MGAKEIYSRLRAAGLTIEGTCGLMGNMQAESGMQANIAQRGMTRLSDEDYTASADMGAIDFAHDAVGYGLCQWTYWSRKRALLEFARARGVSVGDEAMQVDFCIAEMGISYPGLLALLKSVNDVYTAAAEVCTGYERPAVNNIPARATYAQNIYSAATAEAWEGGADKPTEKPAETPTETFWPPRMLDYKAGRKNLRGADVLVLQALLVARGYACPTNGDFDSKTRLAVIGFQAESGLIGDGVAGNATWTALVDMRG